MPSNQGPVSKGAAAFSGHSDARWPTPVRHGNASEGVVIQIDDDWWDGEGKIYLLWAILNPNGPTLYAIGHKKVPGGLRVYFRWMHMLGGKTTFAAQARSSVSGDGLQRDLSEISAHLVSCPTNSFTYTFDLVEDLLACGGPDEGRFRVVGFDEDLDLGDEVLRTDKGSAPDLALGYQSEPAFDLIEP